MAKHWRAQVVLALIVGTLLATLRAASGLSAAYTSTTGSGGETNGTVAGLKDGSDATYAEGWWEGNGIITDSGTYREDWTVDALAPPAGMTYEIEKVRVIARARRVTTAGSGRALRNVQARASGTTQGAAQAAGAVFGNLSYDITTDPLDSQPWSVAKINAAKFGFFIDAATFDENSGGVVQISDLKVEVWGTVVHTPTTVEVSDAAAAPHGYVMANTVAIDESAEWPLTAAKVPDSYQPEDVTEITASDDGTMRVSESPGQALNDGDAINTGAISSTLAGPTATFQDALLSSVLGFTPAPTSTISHIRIFCMGGNTKAATVTSKGIRYKVGSGGARQDVAATGTWPCVDSGNPNQALFADTVASDAITEKPGGGAWTWADVYNLRDVGPVIAVSGMSGTGTLALGECWIEVSGPIGQVGDPIQHKTIQAVPRGDFQGQVGPDEVTQAAGPSRIKLKSKIVTRKP